MEKVSILPYILFGVVAFLSWIVQSNLKRKFKRFSQISMPNGMTGADVATKMLRDNGVNDVQVTSTSG